METLLTVATILGGISAIGYFWDKYRAKSIAKCGVSPTCNALPPNSALVAILKKIHSSASSQENLLVRVVPIYDDPRLIRGEQIALTDLERKQQKVFEQHLIKLKRPNDACAIIDGQINWDDQPLTLNFSPAMYSEIQVKRKNGSRIKMLSVNALLFCYEAQCLVLHRRSEKSDHFPHRLHTFGGAFMPEGLTDRGDIGGIRECIERELQEESGVAIAVPKDTPIALIDEHGIDFIQFAFLGINISKEQLSRMRPNWEGKIVKVNFSELYEHLKNQTEWTPAGWAHVAMWLSLGAPGSITQLKFKGLTAQELAIALTA